LINGSEYIRVYSVRDNPKITDWIKSDSPDGKRITKKKGW
jgi:hypothetical protein